MTTVEALARLLPALAILLGALWAAKRLGQRRTGASGSGPEVLGRTPLSRGAHLATVRVDEQMLLLGVTDRSVTLVTRLDGHHPTADAPLTPAGDFDGAGGRSGFDRPDAERDRAPFGRPASPTGPRTGLITRLRWMTSRASTSPPADAAAPAALRAQMPPLPHTPPARPATGGALGGALADRLRSGSGRGASGLVPRGSA